MAKITIEKESELYEKMNEEKEKYGGGKVTDRVADWLSTKDAIIQINENYDRNNEITKEIKDALQEFDSLDVVLLEQGLEMGGGPELPPFEFSTALNFIMVFALGNLAKGFFQKIGSKLASLAIKTFNIKKKFSNNAAHVAVLYTKPPYYQEIWYIFQNNLDEDSFKIAFLKIPDHYLSIQGEESSKVIFAFDTKSRMWFKDSIE